jgi:hypothetical protein
MYANDASILNMGINPELKNKASNMAFGTR